MNTEPLPRAPLGTAGSTLRSLLLPAGALAVLVGLGWRTAAPEPLQAAELTVPDMDQDGLIDAQEIALQSNPYQRDSDQDNYLDSEELARHSSPLDASDTPSEDPLMVGMSVRGQAGRLHVTVAAYVQDGKLTDKVLAVGLLSGNRIVSVPMHWLLRRAQARTLPGSNGGTIGVFEFPLPPSIVMAGNGCSLYAGIAEAGGPVASAVTIDLAPRGDVIVANEPTTASLTSVAAGNGPQRVGGVDPFTPDIPVPAVTEPPLDWISGQLCIRQTEVVGVRGNKIIHETVAADCVMGFDTFCSSTRCADIIGQISTTLDPAALIGN